MESGRWSRCELKPGAQASLWSPRLSAVACGCGGQGSLTRTSRLLATAAAASLRLVSPSSSRRPTRFDTIHFPWYPSFLAVSPMPSSPARRGASPPSEDHPSSETAEQVKAACKRAAKACLACRSRKVRCDVASCGPPCTRCGQDGKNCLVVGRASRLYVT